MSKIFVDQVDPKTATTLTLGTTGDTVDIPTGVGLTVTDEVKTNKVSPATGTALALGDSGDTITVPVGAVTSLDGAVTVNDSSNDVDFTIEGNGDDDLFFVNGGTDRIGINAGATPEAKLHIIAAGASEPAAYFEQNSANDAMVLINNSRADDGAEISLKFNRADAVQGAIGTTGNGLNFWTGSSLGNRMSISSTGTVDIAGGYTTSGDAGISFDVGGEMNVSRAGTGEQEMMRFANGNGLVGTVKTSGSSTSFNTSSDYRLKENETSITDGIDRIKQLKPYRFNFKTDADKTVDGFFAHEVFSIVPEAISGEKDSMIPEVLYTDKDKLPEGKNIGDVKEETRINPQGIDQSKLVPLLVAAVKELTAKVEALENA